MKLAHLLFNQCWQSLSKSYVDREAKSIAYILLEDRFDITRMDVMMQKGVTLDEDEFENCLQRLKAMEPVQYVTGFTYFMGRKFIVTKDTLIPRPETEELVKWIIDETHRTNPIIWDIGTGSGCIPVSLALEIPSAEVYSSDISPSAIRIAKANMSGLSAKVNFIFSDILTKVPELPQLDVLVSNPPYIPENEKESMLPNVTRFEPKQALYVPDDDPLLFYRRIAEIGHQKLNSNARLFFEINENFGSLVVQLLVQQGYSSVEIRKDFAGKDRMIRAIK